MGAPDVVVIGGGIAGVSVAYELAATRSVLVLEAEAQLGRHSTARSAATYIPGHGVAAVRELVRASLPRFAVLEQELDTPRLLLPRPVLNVSVDDESERALAAEIAERRGEPDATVLVDGAEAERLCPALAPGVVRRAQLVVDAADIDTDALHQGYLRGVRARGGRVRACAPVERIERCGSGMRVVAGGETVDAGLVVDAAGAWADVMARRAGVPVIGLVPHRRTIGVARVPDPSRLRAPEGRLPFVVDPAERFYFKADGDDLMVSPADETPVEPSDARPDDLDVALALERVEEVTHLGLRSVRTAWAGLRSFVPDRRPVVGEWPEHPGFAFVAAQGGSGIETSPALSALAAAVLTGAPVPSDIALDAAVLAPSRLLR